jgi:uncharacterized membrane protein
MQIDALSCPSLILFDHFAIELNMYTITIHQPELSGYLVMIPPIPIIISSDVAVKSL